MLLFLLTFGSAFNAVEGKRAAGDTRPNLVLSFPDTIAASALSIYGNPVVKTPNLDRFAKTAVTFDKAVTSYPQCSPSRVALFTGRHPHVLGHRTMTYLLQDYETNLFRMLKEEGYTTIHLGKNDVLSQASFPLTFTYWAGMSGQDAGNNSYPFGTAGYYSFLSSGGNSLGNNSKVNGDLRAVETAVQWMQQDPVEPFAIFLPGIGAHPPYGAPIDFESLYDPVVLQKEYPLIPPLVNDTSKPSYLGPMGIRYYRNITSLSDNEAYVGLAKYLARITYTDWIFGQLLDGIEGAPNALSNRTAVAFSSDHGDFYFQRMIPEKWSGSGDDLLLHVPLVMRGPMGDPRTADAAGTRIADPVQIFDLFPTFLEMSQYNMTNLTQTYVQFGNSLVPQITANVTPSTPLHKYVFSEAGYLYYNELEYNDPSQKPTWDDPTQIYYPRGQEEHLAPLDCSRFVAMQNATYKIVYRVAGTGVQELYNLEEDPLELHNQWNNSTYSAIKATMLSDLLDWYLQTSDVVPFGDDPRSLPPNHLPPSLERSRNGKTTQRLRTNK
jgi:arylsulfatase A-like enzyme